MLSYKELRLVRETSEMALGDYERRREAEISEVKELLWAARQEAGVLREKDEQQRKTLEERRADIAGFKVRGLQEEGSRSDVGDNVWRDGTCGKERELWEEERNLMDQSDKPLTPSLQLLGLQGAAGSLWGQGERTTEEAVGS